MKGSAGPKYIMEIFSYHVYCLCYVHQNMSLCNLQNNFMTKGNIKKKTKTGRNYKRWYPAKSIITFCKSFIIKFFKIILTAQVSTFQYTKIHYNQCHSGSFINLFCTRITKELWINFASLRDIKNNNYFDSNKFEISNAEQYGRCEWQSILKESNCNCLWRGQVGLGRICKGPFIPFLLDFPEQNKSYGALNETSCSVLLSY